MLFYACCIAAFIGVVALVVILMRRPAASAKQRPSKAGATSAAAIDEATKIREFATLLALTNELDSTILSLRLSICKAGPFVANWLDADSLQMVETRLRTKLQGGEVVRSGELNAVASQLERNLASCQTVCAMIDPGPIESFDTSKDHGSFVSLLARAQKRLSAIPWRMREERLILTDARNDLASAQRWMETASLVVRCIPLKARFADMRVPR